MSIQALPYTVLLGVLYGTSLIASRFGMEQFHPSVYVGLRMSLASLAYLLVYLLDRRRRKLPREPILWRRAALLGVFGSAIPMTSIVSSMQFQSAGVTSIWLTTGPIFTVLMAHFFLDDEALTTRKSVGVAVALAGALLLAVRGESGLADVDKANPLGYGLVLLGMVCNSGMNIYARKFMRDLDAFDVASVRMFAAALTVMPLSALFVGINLGGVNVQGYISLGYASLIGTFLATGLAFYLIKRFGSTATAMALYVTPIVGGLGGVLLLNEHISAGMVAGMGFITVGIALIKQKKAEVII